ncbi:hypothetical protein D9758_018832 [Tetrapyrgos nigripes]|uniref:Uncharacterized protein n=1 Tax=Tetrapyrgos nigripes TaxID=182062 RepID=A0A8H5BB70_9AGAR|nr:hypothetical protein D9758_018832 [Tetrapyrgos nigripes]
MVMVSNPPDVCRIRDGPFSTFCLFGLAVTSERAHTRLAPIHPYFVPRHPPSSAIPPPLPLAPCPKHHHSGFDSGVLPPSEHDGSGLEAVPSCPHSISVPVLPKFQLHSPTSFPPNPLISYSILRLLDPPNPMTALRIRGAAPAEGSLWTQRVPTPSFNPECTSFFLPASKTLYTRMTKNRSTIALRIPGAIAFEAPL